MSQLVEHLADVVGVDFAGEEALELQHRERLRSRKERGFEHAFHFRDVDRLQHRQRIAGRRLGGPFFFRQLRIGLIVHVQAMASVGRSDLSFT